MTRAYREVDPIVFQERWFKGLDPAIAELVEKRGWTRILTDALASGNARIRVPNGSVRDIANFWMANRPLYEPRLIAAPTLVIVGTQDRDTPPVIGRAVYDLLTVSDRRFVEVPGGTHFMLMEPARGELFATVREFLSA